jgi:hypothetical protein
LILLGALTLCVAPVSLGIMVLRSKPDARWSGAATASSPRPAASPGPGDPTPVVAAWLRDRMSEALTRQATALLAGDEKGFLAPALRWESMTGVLSDLASTPTSRSSIQIR